MSECGRGFDIETSVQRSLLASCHSYSLTPGGYGAYLEVFPHC